MKVTQQRNPYLKRIYSQTPHKYSFDMDSGKYFLLDEQGTASLINPNGTFRPKFRSGFSGFVDHKTRYIQSSADPSVLHYAPDPQPQTLYHNPVPDKFEGYAQFPYQLHPPLSKYLKRPGETPNYPRKKAQSLILANEKKIESKPKPTKQAHSAILEYSTTKITGNNEEALFNSAWNAMSHTKPLPKQRKKTCYNYKCKYLKQWTFDQRGKLEQKKVVNLKDPNNTQNRSFHQGTLTQEMQESKLLSTMALSGIA